MQQVQSTSFSFQNFRNGTVVHLIYADMKLLSIKLLKTTPIGGQGASLFAWQEHVIYFRRQFRRVLRVARCVRIASIYNTVDEVKFLA